MKKIITILVLISCTLSHIGLAQTSANRLTGIKSTNATIAHKNGKIVDIDATIDLTNMPAISTNLLMEVKPVLISNTSSDEYTLPVFLITGRTRHIMLQREMRATKDHIYHQEQYQPLKIYVRHNGKEQQLHYQAQIPFAQWMKDASLILTSRNTGCAGCPDGELEETTLSSNALAPLYQPQYQYSSIIPAGELLKRREETFTAHINYLVNRYHIDPNLENNREELDRVSEKIKSIINDKTISLDQVTMNGYASPEGGVTYNQALSERRVKGFVAHVIKLFPPLKDKIQSSAKGQDWNGLQRQVEESQLADKKAIIQIITSQPAEERSTALKELSEGKTYTTLLSDYYPRLRRSELIFSFVVKGFSLTEAKEEFLKHPNRLSLAEIHAVAESYPKGSPEEYQTWVTAAAAFPNAVAPAMNAAILDFQAQRYAQAVQLLEKYQSNPGLWSILGVAYAYNGQYEEAEALLEKAAKKNVANAQHNLEELRRFLKDNF